jgi:hypothetical protein
MGNVCFKLRMLKYRLVGVDKYRINAMIEQDRVDRFSRKLYKEGHTCMYELLSYPSKLVWCNKKICIESHNY